MIRHLDKKKKCIKNIQSYKYSDDQLYKMSLEIIKIDIINTNMTTNPTTNPTTNMNMATNMDTNMATNMATNMDTTMDTNMDRTTNTDTNMDMNSNNVVKTICMINDMNYCKYCFKHFSTKGNLKKHLNKHESGSIPVFPEEYYEDKKEYKEYEEQLYKIEEINIGKSQTLDQLYNTNPYIIQNEEDDVHHEKNKNKNTNNKNNKNMNKNKSVTQTINNITVNQQFNNYNIINMKYPNGFDKDWDLSQISHEKKLLLINTCNTKYSELLKFILQNDDNLNVIIENETNTGIVYKNDIEKYIHLNKSEIIDQSLIKLKSQLNNLCDEICMKKDSTIENIQKYQYENLSINKKFDNYMKNNNDIKNGVQDIIFNIFNEKKEETINIMNKIIENETNDNLLKNGF